MSATCKHCGAKVLTSADVRVHWFCTRKVELDTESIDNSRTEIAMSRHSITIVNKKTLKKLDKKASGRKHDNDLLAAIRSLPDHDDLLAAAESLPDFTVVAEFGLQVLCRVSDDYWAIIGPDDMDDDVVDNLKAFESLPSMPGQTWEILATEWFGNEALTHIELQPVAVGGIR